MKWKFYTSRSISYISLINLVMILYLTLDRLKSSEVLNIDLSKMMIPIVIFSLVCITIFGFIEVKILKGLKLEQDLVYQSTAIHPDLQDMKKKIDVLYMKEMIK